MDNQTLPIVPRWFDDYGFNPNEYRILMRIINNNQNRYNESIMEMALTCRMEFETVEETIKSLEDKKYITATRAIGKMTVYTAIFKNDWDEPSNIAKDPTLLINNPGIAGKANSYKLNEIPNELLNPLPQNDSTKKRFVKPTIEQVEAYFKEIFVPPTEGQKFMDYHDSGGWMVGRKPMKDWKAACRTWRNNYTKFNPQARDQAPQPKRRLSDEERLKAML